LFQAWDGVGLSDVKSIPLLAPLDKIVDGHQQAVAQKRDNQQVRILRELDNEVRPVSQATSRCEKQDFDVCVVRELLKLEIILQLLKMRSDYE
jgi:hypothetical protein